MLKIIKIMKAQIIIATDYYHAARDARFAPGKRECVLDEFGSLKEANRALLAKFNGLKPGMGFPNWGLAAAWEGGDNVLYACKTFENGTRAFVHDVYAYGTRIVD